MRITISQIKTLSPYAEIIKQDDYQICVIRGQIVQQVSISLRFITKSIYLSQRSHSYRLSLAHYIWNLLILCIVNVQNLTTQINNYMNIYKFK